MQKFILLIFLSLFSFSLLSNQSIIDEDIPFKKEYQGKTHSFAPYINNIYGVYNAIGLSYRYKQLEINTETGFLMTSLGSFSSGLTYYTLKQKNSNFIMGVSINAMIFDTDFVGTSLGLMWRYVANDYIQPLIKIGLAYTPECVSGGNDDTCSGTVFPYIGVSLYAPILSF